MNTPRYINPLTDFGFKKVGDISELVNMTDLKSLNIPIDTIAQATGLSIEQIKKL